MALRRPTTDENPLLIAEGFARFYERHAQPLLIFLTRRVYDPEVGLDLMAETFAQAFHSRRQLRGRTDAEQAGWLYAIARHQLSTYFRRGSAERRAVARLGLEVPELSPEELARVEELSDLTALRAEVAQALDQLSADQRRALELRVVDELPYGEVADRLGVSEPTARARVSRGLRALAELLTLNPTSEEAAS